MTTKGPAATEKGEDMLTPKERQAILEADDLMINMTIYVDISSYFPIEVKFKDMNKR